MPSWRTWLVGYLLWLIVFTVVEGAGRQVCRMPAAKWIAAGADARDRNARLWFRDRANECLERTAWYAYTLRMLFVVGMAAPLAAAWTVRKKIRTTTLACAVVAALGILLGSMEGVRWLYDWAS